MLLSLKNMSTITAPFPARHSVVISCKLPKHCKGNSVYIFLFWELRGLSPNLNIHVSVGDLYTGSVHIFPLAEKADPSWEYIIRSQTHECGIWD